MYAGCRLTREKGWLGAFRAPETSRTLQDTVRWSPTRFYLFGTDSEEVDELDVDTFLDAVHPEDRELGYVSLVADA